MSVMVSARPVAKVHQRQPVFSLRSLMGLIALLGVILATFMAPGERERRAAAAITAGGGTVLFEHADSAADAPPAAGSIKSIVPAAYWDDAVTVDLSGTRVSDADLVHLHALPTLRGLWLHETGITDAGLTHLETLSGLQTLNLAGTAVTDAGLSHLERLPGLRYLNLTDTQATSAGVEALRAALPHCTIVP
jgi:hypothetical protein